jgi:hypothetical protein
MPNELERILLCFVLPLVACAASWAQSTAPQPVPPEEETKKVYLPSKHSALPTPGESEGDSSETPSQREHRQAREAHLGRRSLTPITDPGVGGQNQSLDVMMLDFAVVRGTKDVPSEPQGIPVWGSNTVVVGTVLSGKSHMSAAHNNVYTDYQIRVDQILKPDKTAKLAVGQSLTASRSGGVIQFPSGHTKGFYFEGWGLPKVGSQYILFLKKTVPDLPEYRIAWPSGYELKDGRVYPLDDALTQYEGFSASAFLGLVRDTIASSKEGK